MLAGEALKRFRNNRKITVRQVESASERIAQVKGDKRFRLSNGWLAQLENGTSEPSICKLFSLSVIYNVAFCDLVRVYDVDISEIHKYRIVAKPDETQLLAQGVQDLQTAELQKASDFNPQRYGTTLVPSATSLPHTPYGPASSPTSSVSYGYIGMNDLTMYPLIRPGSFVCIDNTQTKWRPFVWRNEYERPIYFIEVRNGYVCGWCEVHAGHLLVIPHHSSPLSIRSLPYPQEAEIIGRVTSFNTRCVDSISE
jgi:transcriptional regulator with XRE-family HTH domain